jgi:hypothetical protein
MNADGTFTVHFGSKDACGDVPNRLDVSEGWNFLMRVYRPGPSVLDGSYTLPMIVETNPPIVDANHLVTPADFGATDTAYKVSETDFNMKRHLAKAPVNHWAHQDDANNVKSQQVIQIIDFQNYIVRVLYPGESLTVTLDKVGYGDYVYLNMRICKLPAEKGGLEATHKLQRQATISANAARPYRTPGIALDSALMEKIRMALIRDVETGKYTDTTRVMGTPQDTYPQGHLYATAYGWSGLAVDDAAYKPIDKNLTKVEEGKALPSSITFNPPEIDYSRGGFWSITTYNLEGWLAKDQAAISNDQAEPNADGTYTIRFNSPGQKNNVKTPAPFSALLRVYAPKSRQGIIEYLAKMRDALVIR